MKILANYFIDTECSALREKNIIIIIRINVLELVEGLSHM